MNMTGLSLEQAPPFASVARFFITAPLFGAIFGLFLTFSGPEILNRFAPQTIAIVHLFTIGFVTMSIFGSLSQMLPVLAGVKIAKFEIIGKIVHFLLSLGTLCFFASFYFQIEQAKTVGLLALLLAITSYVIPLLYSIIKAKMSDFTIQGMFIAIIFAIFGLTLGIHLLASHAFGHFASSHLLLANIHIILSVFGFIGLMIIAVAHQVLPMFFVAPTFPGFCKKFTYIFATALSSFATLTIVNIDNEIFIKLSIALFMSAFAFVALKKINERRRKVSDASLKYWQIGLVSLISGSIMLPISLFVSLDNSDYIFSILFGIGFIGSMVKAMLNKIVPFLTWFHLTSEGNFDAPNINEMLPQKMAMTEFWLHNSALAFLLIGIKINLSIMMGGALLTLSFLLLASNLYKASRYYKKLSTLSPMKS